MKSSRILEQRLFEWSTALEHHLKVQAICLPDGTAFHVSPSHWTDPALLPFAAEVVSKYFRPQTGDIFFLNDPYGGGSDLSQITVVSAIGAAKYLAVARAPSSTRVSLSQSIHDEGLRIPPTPIFSQGSLNKEILQVIGSHPLAPPNFADDVSRFILDFHQRVSETVDLPQFRGELLETEFIQETLANHLSRFRERLCDIPAAEAIEEIVLADKTKIRLRTVVRKGEILFDFGGTSGPQSFALTDRAVAGICLSSLLLTLDWNGPIDSKLFDCLKIQTPVGSCVNAKFPQSLSLGFRDGAALIANLIFKTLSQIDSTLFHPQMSPIHCAYCVKFENGLEFHDTLTPGLPAFDFRMNSKLHRQILIKGNSISLEECEVKYPLKFVIVGSRKNSGGHGEREGQPGKTKVIELKEKATLSWQFIPYERRPEGSRGGKAGAAPEIGILRSGTNEVVHLGFSGTESLAAGDRIVIQSAGGGGFGEASTDTADIDTP